MRLAATARKSAGRRKEREFRYAGVTCSRGRVGESLDINSVSATRAPKKRCKYTYMRDKMLRSRRYTYICVVTR